MEQICATVRKARPEDAPRLLEIYSYYVEKTAVSFEYTTPSLSEFKTRMDNVMKKYPYLVIEDNGKILGYSYAGPFAGRAAYGWSCEMTIYLDKDERRHGLGRQLYETLEEKLHQMGILNLYACIGSPEKEDEFLSNDSERFHSRLGFHRAGVFHKCGYKFGRWYNMIWMEKIIGEHKSISEEGKN